MDNPWFPHAAVQTGIILALAFLCRGHLLALEGLWWDDWAWAWHYFCSGSLGEFILPFKSLGHQLIGFILYMNFQWFDISPAHASNIWQIEFFILLTANAYLLWAIGRRLCSPASLIPILIATIYLLSPVINIFCLTTQPYHTMLLFYLISILLTMKSLMNSPYAWTSETLSYLFYFFSIMGLESFILFEVSRLIIIYVLLARSESVPNNLFWQTLKRWLPYLLISALAIVYVLFLQPKFGVYQNAYALPALNTEGLVRVKNNYVISLNYIYHVWKYAFIQIGVPVFFQNVYKTATFLALAVILTILVRTPSSVKKTASSRLKRNTVITFLFGLSLVFAGLTPYMLTRSAVMYGIGSRHGLLANIGAAIIIASVLALIQGAGIVGRFIFSCLLMLAIIGGTLFNNSIVEGYQRDWRQQSSFWRAFTTRVPDLKDHSFVIIDMPRKEMGLFGPWRSDYEFAAPLSIFYTKATGENNADSHFAESMSDAFDRKSIIAWVNHWDETAVEYESFKGTKKIYPQNLLVVQYQNGNLLVNEEIQNVLMVQKLEIRPLIARTDPRRIEYGSSDREYPLRMLLGPESLLQER